MRRPLRRRTPLMALLAGMGARRCARAIAGLREGWGTQALDMTLSRGASGVCEPGA